MKKIISVLLILICLCGCNGGAEVTADPDKMYLSLIDSLLEHNSFSTSSSYYDLTCEMAMIDDGYRFYVTIDNPTSALYDVEAIAVEEDVDYTKNMAANIGIFEDSEYCLIPNQTNPDKGYMKGIVISGVSQNAETTLYIYVSFKNEDHSTTHSEYFKINVKYEG